MSTKKRKVSKAEMGTAVRLAALLHAYDPGAFRSLSGPATEALRIMSTDGEARRMAIMLTDRIVAANRLVDALDAIADEPARDVEVVSWAKAIRGLEEEANRASALATFLAELVTWKEAR